MKKLYSLLVGLFIIGTSNGQIKIVDDSFKTDVATISVLNQPVDAKLEEKYPRYIPLKPQIVSFRDGGSRGSAENPVGEKFYVCKEYEKEQFVRLDPSDSTACVASLPIGYYEFIGIIFTSDQLNEHRENVLRYRISSQERKTIENLMSVNVISASPDAASMKQLKLYLNGLPNNWASFGYFNNGAGTRPLLPIYICRNSNGQSFYIPIYCMMIRNMWADIEYVMLSYYERAQKMIGQQVVLCRNGKAAVRDYISKEPVVIDPSYLCAPILNINNRPVLNPELKYCICKDIVLKDNKTLAIVEYKQGSFAVPLFDIVPQDLMPHGFGAITTDVYRSPDIRIIPKYELEQTLKEYNIKRAEKEQTAKIEAARSAQVIAQYKNERMKELSLKYGAEKAKKILDRKVELGMTMDMCRDAWGIPNDQLTTVTNDGTARVWIYNYKTRLYFYNNILKIIQN